MQYAIKIKVKFKRSMIYNNNNNNEHKQTIIKTLNINAPHTHYEIDNIKQKK